MNPFGLSWFPPSKITCDTPLASMSDKYSLRSAMPETIIAVESGTPDVSIARFALVSLVNTNNETIPLGSMPVANLLKCGLLRSTLLKWMHHNGIEYSNSEPSVRITLMRSPGFKQLYSGRTATTTLGLERFQIGWNGMNSVSVKAGQSPCDVTKCLRMSHKKRILFESRRFDWMFLWLRFST